MGFYKSLKDNQDTNLSDEERRLEETYEKLFPKIARDFMCRKDVEAIFDYLFLLIDLDNQPDNEKVRLIRHALLLAREYKLNLKRPIDKRKTYKDIDELK